jgi:hypothetical protein
VIDGWICSIGRIILLRKPKYLDESLSHCHFFHHKAHVVGSVIWCGLVWWVWWLTARAVVVVTESCREGSLYVAYSVLTCVGFILYIHHSILTSVHFICVCFICSSQHPYLCALYVCVICMFVTVSLFACALYVCALYVRHSILTYVHFIHVCFTCLSQCPHLYLLWMFFTASLLVCAVTVTMQH